MERNKRILIVDDQRDLREQLAKLLHRSAKENETTSLVQQMKAKLMGSKDEEDSQEQLDDSNIAEDNYIADIASQGEEAFKMVQEANANEDPYAMMFLDMRMPPGWDGLETAKRIREIDQNIEIVIMTAYADHDQKTIAEQVGKPEKLLYIKKPFQAEEIYQLALCLTTKWSAEQLEKLRKEWLEGLIRCMSKIKSIVSTRQGDTYVTALKSVFSFTKASKGFITVWDEKEEKWLIKGSVDIDIKEAEKFVEENSQRLNESRTTQSVEGKYFLPLKRNRFIAVMVLYDLVTQNDPEWYKLLSLLVMTTSEVLSNAALTDDFLKQERFSAVGFATSRISHEAENYLGNMISYATYLKEHIESGSENEKYVNNIIKSAEILSRQMKNILVYGLDDTNIELQNTNIIPIITIVCEMEKHNVLKKNQIELSYNITSPDDVTIKADADLLHSVFMNLLLNSINASLKSNDKLLKIDITITAEDNNFKVVYQDNGPGIPEEKQNKLFAPFNVDNSEEHGFGLGLPIVKQILEKHKGTISLDSSYSDGAKFIILLPKPQA